MPQSASHYASILTTHGGAAPVQLAAPAASGLARYRKDAIRVGTWYARDPDTGKPIELKVTPERLDRWASNFARMQANGVSVDLTVDHKRGAEAKRGNVSSLFRDGEALYFDAVPADNDAETLLQRCPEVSIEIDRDVRDGAGNAYDEAITAVSLCRKPVVTGQQPFERIAASREDDAAALRTAAHAALWFSANPPADPAHPSRGPQRSNAMFTDEQLKQVRQKLNLGEDVKDEQVAEKLLLSLDAAAKVPELEQQVQQKDQKLGEVNAELAQAREKAEPIKLSQDVQGVLEEAVDTKLSTLVEQNRLTEAAAHKLKPVLKTGAIMLSREANGGDQARAMQILDALAENDPAKIAELSQEKSGPQTTILSRQVPGDSGGQDDEQAKAEEQALRDRYKQRS